MKLNEFFKNAPEIEIEQLSTDSRLPMRNAIFFCLNGIKYDGHNFINEAISNGAKVIVYSKDNISKSNAILIKVKDVNDTLNRIADKFYNYPNKKINNYLINGCYGRSTVSSIIKYYLDSISNCASIGIFGINYKDRHLSLPNHALTSLENLKSLDTFVKNGIKNAVFEANSIDLFYKKMDMLKPQVFAYTSTSIHSSDYKSCYTFYYENIRRYLYTLENSTSVLLNKDDDSFNELKDCVDNYYTYGTKTDCDYLINNIRLSNNHSEFIIKHLDIEYHVDTKLIGLNNVYNLTCAIASLNIQGYDIEDICEKIKNMNYIDGVMERIDDEYNIIIDCGYEIDSIKEIFEYASNIKTNKIVCVLGINYSDSESKIESIIKLAEQYVDKLILTEDESDQAEVMNILSRCDKYISGKIGVAYVQYRGEAINNAINIINKNDILLILGKGNEDYLLMSFGKERYLGDKIYALKYLKERKKYENETSEIY